MDSPQWLRRILSGHDRLGSLAGVIDSALLTSHSDIFDERRNVLPGGRTVFHQVGKTPLVDFTPGCDWPGPAAE
jgi:hypothetical protein